MSPRGPLPRMIVVSALLSLLVGLGVALLVRANVPRSGGGELSPSSDWMPAAAAAGLAFLGMLVVSWSVARAMSGAPRGKPAEAARRRDPAIALLAVLQREGRLVDFLREDISAYSDAQVGAAARSIHACCRKALDEHLLLEPVRTEDEGARIVVPNGFDPSAIRLTGRVGGKPPFRGVLRHRGWRTKQVELPTDPAGQDLSIIAPAEVEIT